MILKPGTCLAATMRMIIAMVMFASILNPDLAGAFALGSIRVTGDFNKQFKAEIPALTDGEQGLKAWIGSERDYKKVGVLRPTFLGSLSLQIADHPTLPGQKIIYVISREPIFQPSFNLLIKASLGGGSILKNYFLAVDFQKNMNLSLNSDSAEEKKEMERIAKELRKQRPGGEKIVHDKPSGAKEKERAMLDKIREEEREAVRKEEAPATIVRKKRIEEPKAIARRAKPKIKPLPKVVPAPARVAKKAPSVVSAIVPKVVKKQDKQVSRWEGIVLPISGVAAEDRYEAIKGDSLYKIAKKLGASRRDYDRVVVAIWKENQKSFIKGNIHALMAGAELDYSNVNVTARSITSSEAWKIIHRQWPAWVARRERFLATAGKRGGAKAGVDEKSSIAKVGVKSDTLALLAEKKPRQAPVKPHKAVDDFIKNQSRPYVTHVASFKKRHEAQKFAEALNVKGYNAFVSLNFIEGNGYWHRVIVGRFRSGEEARQMANELHRLDISQYSRLLDLPYSLKVATAFTVDESRKRIEQLALKGVFAYTLAAKGRGGDETARTDIYVGAFRGKKDALEAVKRLNATGIECEVVKP